MTETARITEIPKNSREVIRVGLDEYHGHHFANLRVWYDPQDGGPLRPSKKGVSIPLRILTDVQDALGLTLQEARERGLLRVGDVVPFRQGVMIEE